MLSGALLATGCAAGRPAVPDRQTLAARYLAIAEEGNRRLETDFDGLAGPNRADLAAAGADLRDAEATEQHFDRQLLAIVFPPATEAVAHRLVSANEARAGLTRIAAGATSLPQLQQYEEKLKDANRTVEHEVDTIRSRLGLPPPDTG